jgi:hypothetical protein
MKKLFPSVAALLLSVSMSAQSYVFNREPLEPVEYAELPLGAIRPGGWLKEQLQRQANGLTGHLDEIYPEVMGPDNAWLGGEGDAWERGPYWLDGLLPLAYILNDDALKAKAQTWVEAMLASQREDGFFGPSEDRPGVPGLQRGNAQDWWPRMVALKVLRQYYMATGDQRIPDMMTRYLHYMGMALREHPLNHWTDWGKWRGGDNLDIVYWLYNLTGDRMLPGVGEAIHRQTALWTGFFLDGFIFQEPGDVHCVNLAHGFKEPIVHWQYSNDLGEYGAPKKALDFIAETVGLPTGLWAGDEMLQMGAPTRGSELCTAVEMMYSLETVLRITGEPQWADLLERVAYNALPAQVDAAFSSKQYFQQVNQVACTREPRDFSTVHGDTDLVFGTLSGYPCCLSNMHQGWPKFTQNLWYATPDGGLAALVYAPNAVTAEVKGGIKVRLTETTDYPFRDKVTVRIDFEDPSVKSASFPLRFRVPGWAWGSEVYVNGKLSGNPPFGEVLMLEHTWRKGDEITLVFPMQTQAEEGYEGAWSVVRGPLVYALKMEENWTEKAFEGEDLKYGPSYREVTSASPWNYCLVQDAFEMDGCPVKEKPMAAFPWTSTDAPVSLTVPARVLPDWRVVDRVTFHRDDVSDCGEEKQIELIPYGCTKLRIASFPTRRLTPRKETKVEYVTY